MPPEIPDQRTVEAARAALNRAVERRRETARALASNTAELTSLSRKRGPDDERVKAARAEGERLAAELEEARTAVDGARRDLAGHLEKWLTPDAPEDVSRLSADFPIVLFPVRVETRFDSASSPQPMLKVRVFPDTVVAEAHDPLLTGTEFDAGVAYWRRAWTNEPQAWRELLRQTRAPRAAWIVLATEPSNRSERPEGEPRIPQLELRAEAWERPVEARVLPDRWVVLGFRERREVLRAVSRPIQQPLAVGFDPQTLPSEGVDITGDGLRLDPDLAWTVDFARAEDAGMAVSVAIAEEDVMRGFDRLLVFGVKGSLSPEAGSQALRSLLDGHHYNAGLAVLPQGTSTNNTETGSSGYPLPDPDGVRSFAVERSDPLNTKNGDGARLMRALGVPPAVAAHIEGASRTEQIASDAMNGALWPATWGYFLTQMMAPHLAGDAIDAARAHFVEFVRGRGPLPAVRVRGQPYGIVPVCSLARWQPGAGATGLEVRLPELLRRLLPVWAQQIDDVPRVGRTSDADADLLSVLGKDASTREVRVRRVHGPDFTRNLLAFLKVNPTVWEQGQTGITRPLMQLIGFPDWQPRILRMTMAERPARLKDALVAAPPLSEQLGLAFDYVGWIRDASITELRDERLPDGQPRPQALLYRLLRHARLVEFARVAVELDAAHGQAKADDRVEPELIGVVDGTATRATVWQRFERPIPSLTGQTSLGEFLSKKRDIQATAALADHDAALDALVGLPTAELDRLIGETLDSCSHRIDAWVTSLATRRLASMRNANPIGVHLGAYGWVENLRPANPARFRIVSLPDGRTVRVSDTNGGHIHAPSLSHAAAAAVLRNGYRTRSGESRAQYAIDLSSRRVRVAVAVLDAVREGQALGAILGYQFERGLHEGHRPLELSRFIEPLRRRFPLVANKAGNTNDAPEAAAARNVVDGLALLTAWKESPDSVSGLLADGRLPSKRELSAVNAELHRTDEAMDSVADLLTAEAVYRIVNGDAAHANASLDAIAKGARPPDPAIAHQPRSGVTVTHRVVVVLGGSEVPKAVGWEATHTPRARAEPFIDEWAGHLLGDPRAVRCRVSMTATDATDASVVQVALADLALRPIDILALAQESSHGPLLVGELERRLVDVAGTRGTAGARAEVIYTRDDSWPRGEIRTFPELLEMARALNQLLAIARPLVPAHLVPVTEQPEKTDAIEDNSTRARGLGARDGLKQALAALRQAIAAQNSATITAALRSASLFGIPGAFPALATENTATDLLEVARSVESEMVRRLAQAAETERASSIAKAVFGPGFVFLPSFVPSAADELEQALAAGAALVGEPTAPERWMFQSARVRPALGHWRKLMLYSRCWRTHRGSLDVAQLPFVAGERWVALPFAPDAKAPTGKVSIVLHRVATPNADAPWVGLLLDEWVERIPAKDALTGIAFHYDSPGAEPPQSLLLAIPSVQAGQWTLDDLTAILIETLSLAKVRTVDGDLLGELGQMLPAILLTTNAARDTVSADFQGALIGEQLAAPPGA